MTWPPETEEDLRRAADSGLLAEAHDRDVKREMPRAGPGGNFDLAIDMASMAVDGGLLIYGIDETAEPPSLVPAMLAGVKERIDQVSKSLIDEPLHVRVIEIRSSGDPDQGYIVVVVPPSATRPHQVRGKYRGRGDTANRVLSDGEVVRLHEQRRRWEAETAELLEDMVKRDPTADWRGQAHLFVLGNPLAAGDELVLRSMGSHRWQQWIIEKITQGPAAVTFDQQWGPDFPAMGVVSRRAGGWAAHSSRIQQDGSVDAGTDEAGLIELEVSEGGSLRLFCGRGSDTLEASKVVFDSLITGLVKRVVLAARLVATECGYAGSWDFGVAMTGLRGAASYDRSQGLGEVSRYSEAEYRRTTRATYEEVLHEPDAVVMRLVGRLRRAFGDEGRPIPQALP